MKKNRDEAQELYSGIAQKSNSFDSHKQLPWLIIVGVALLVFWGGYILIALIGALFN